ncbi:MAG: RES family NAD+ phosphorylase [Bacteroidetes bacterium]|jgi:RES domain-containing protein|nr:RES family NAD+ phosphorylase [Bacteroidota bacterium]
MIVYRVGKTKHAKDLSGEGARLFGGRWNHQLSPCLYTSATRALAILEFSVNVHLEDLPHLLSITSIEIPDKLIKELKASEIPADWKTIPAPSSTKNLGTEFLKALASPILKVPSVIIEEEFNFLLNPLHKESSRFKIVDIKAISYDERIKLIKS